MKKNIKKGLVPILAASIIGSVFMPSLNSSATYAQSDEKQETSLGKILLRCYFIDKRIGYLNDLVDSLKTKPSRENPKYNEFSREIISPLHKKIEASFAESQLESNNINNRLRLTIEDSTKTIPVIDMSIEDWRKLAYGESDSTYTSYSRIKEFLEVLRKDD